MAKTPPRKPATKKASKSVIKSVGSNRRAAPVQPVITVDTDTAQPSSPPIAPTASLSSSGNPPPPPWLQHALSYTQQNPAISIVSLIAIVLGFMLILN